MSALPGAAEPQVTSAEALQPTMAPSLKLLKGLSGASVHASTPVPVPKTSAPTPPAPIAVSLLDDLERRAKVCYAKYRALKASGAPQADVDRYRRLGKYLKNALEALQVNGDMTREDLEGEIGPLTLAGIDAQIAAEPAEPTPAPAPHAPPPRIYSPAMQANIDACLAKKAAEG